jgi:membrane protein YqaA with SNARE-associated domain
VENVSEKRSVYQWILQHAHARYAYQLFLALFSLEIILLIPLDPVMAFFAMHRKDDAYKFVLLGVLGSILGAGIGYALGGFLWEMIGKQILLLFVSELRLTAFVANYQLQYMPTVFFGALVPFPFKLLTASAGLAKIPLIPFLSVVAAARAVRFCVISYVSIRWGAEVKLFLHRYGRHILFLLAVALLIALGWYAVFF